jgi:hypothetical protein
MPDLIRTPAIFADNPTRLMTAGALGRRTATWLTNGRDT